MAIYVVTWNLNREGANYNAKRQALIDRIGQYDNMRDNQLDSTHFLSSAFSVTDVATHLRSGLDDDDRLFVAQVLAATSGGLLHPNAWNWINARG